MGSTEFIAPDSTAREASGLGARRRALLAALSGFGLLGVAGLVAAADRLPNWSLSVGGVTTELGPGRRTVSVGEVAPVPTVGPTGRRGNRNPIDAANNVSGAATRHTFDTYGETEAFVAKAGVHALNPGWLPEGFQAEPFAVALTQLPPEMVIASGRPQRVAITQRFVSGDGTLTIVQSLPPPVFDLFMDAGRAEDALSLASGVTAQFGIYPQGVVVYWRERGDVRSVGIVGDTGAAARLTRADWLKLADSLA